MPQSPELAGGEAFTFEGNVAAIYLTALLDEAYAPGIDDRIVIRVSVQQRDFGEPLDDVIVDFENSNKEPARLSLQVKRSLTISQAKANTEFREIIRDSLSTFKKSNFRVGSDRYGAAVDTITPTKERALKTLCDWARESLTHDHFDARFAKSGNASTEIKTIKDDIVALLEESKGTSCTSEEVHQFLAHFVLIKFDFLREGATDHSDAINRIRHCLTRDDATKAPLVWSKMIDLARTSAGKAGQFDRARLVYSISSVARLRGAVSLHSDLNKLVELAKSYKSLIPDDISGTKLDRTLLIRELEVKLTAARVVQIRGLPGSGKSVLIKQAVQHALEHGSVLFLKAEQLEGTSWISYATSQGLSNAPLEQLLVEVGATGTPIFFVDAIDRIEKEHQSIILDVIRTITESPLLDNWRIIVSLRDTGIEVLRNWLGEFLDLLKVETLNIGQLSDDDAETLANAKPHLRPLLFGSVHVQEIVRRPFFAKILSHAHVIESGIPASPPQSEIDLIENWWRRGGYNEIGQNAIERQRTLLDLARIRARHLNQPIRISELNSIAHIDDLISDGVLQHAREGISVRFTHDIFFEWSFFHALADSGSQWMNEIKTSGEPPVLGRVVELASQWEYTKGKNWQTYLVQAENSELRSQWLRAWLVGPFGTAKFEDHESQFVATVFTNNFYLFRKILVWFQAEKTSPNVNILVGTLSPNEREQFAYFLGWPSDFTAWRRLINFILRRILEIPPQLYPEIVAIFEVWQNALAGYHNPTSHDLLKQCATWLTDINIISNTDRPHENSEFWKKVPDFNVFRQSLSQLILRSSKAEPIFTTEYLQQIITLKHIPNDTFRDIITYSPILSQSLPLSLVELSLVFLREELPDDQVARQKQELHDRAEWRKTALTKPEAERTQREQMALSSDDYFLMSMFNFSYHDWEKLSIHDDHRSFSPPSPLREPFHSLFKSSPDQALRLLRDLCNHAMMAWRQLHRHSRDEDRTPLPLELTFPWGTQKFWGSNRIYLWFRSIWAPKVIACGFMALEEWCFDELSRNRPVDELIQQILEENECIAILGIASMLALHTKRVSETTLPLFTSQRLLDADHERMVQDYQSIVNLIGFMHSSDQAHVNAIKTANARPIRKTQLKWMIPEFIFAPEPICSRSREAILNFKNDLPYQYEEHCDDSRAREYFTIQALEYAELAEPHNYRVYETKDDPDQIAIVHVSPSAAKPENIARVEEASRELKQTSLWTWAYNCFEEKTLSRTYTIENAISMAREMDTRNLFELSKTENDEGQLSVRRGAVSATAAIVLSFREGRTPEELKWAREILTRAIHLPEKPNLMWSPISSIPWHQAIYVARGLAADLRENTSTVNASHDLLGLIAHPLEIVSLAALEEACKLCTKDLKLTWAALILAFSLCHIRARPRAQVRKYEESLHSSSEVQAAIDTAFGFYESENEWLPLPLPPPAWVKVKPSKRARIQQAYEEYDADDAVDATEIWDEPDVFWHSKRAADILKLIPLTEILNSGAKNVLLDFLTIVLEWTNQKIAPPWVKPGRRDRSGTSILEWIHALGSKLGLIAGLLPLSDFQVRFLNPILLLEGDNCWSLLAPFTHTYICTYVYDAQIVPTDAITILHLCLERFLQDRTFKRDTYRSGEFSGFDQPKLIRTLMFVSVERTELAARYVNGDWSEISRILPLIDRFIRVGGWAASIMESFLALCARAKADYPAEVFADQILSIIGNGSDNLKGWHGKFIPADIADLIHYFAYRDTPMKLALAQKLLRILDILVDMGDRRSAALQLNEMFREVCLPYQ